MQRLPTPLLPQPLPLSACPAGGGGAAGAPLGERCSVMRSPLWFFTWILGCCHGELQKAKPFGISLETSGHRASPGVPTAPGRGSVPVTSWGFWVTSLGEPAQA